MIRRAALALALTIAATVNPTADATTRPNPRPATVTHDELRSILGALNQTTSSPHFARWVETLAYPPNPNDHCPYRALIVHTFPDWPQAVAVAWRESRCQPSAANPTSSARGLMQLLQSLHADRYYATGACTPNEWADAWCNLHAARDLYDIAGSAPWTP